MSQIYNLEPPTIGKVILETTHGPLHINLWTQEAPTTTKNFLQHCLNGYYDNLCFHRIIPQVLVQTGDPTKTGNGGRAALGDPKGYPRELHGRLKFRRRGLVAMVCDNALARSQFFITLSPTEWLNGEHSIFGEVAGNTIYNLLNLAENQVDGFDVQGAPRVKRAKILENPFKDMTAEKVEKEIGKVEQAVNAKRAIRRKNLLSFAGSDSEDEDGIIVTPKRPRSRFTNSKVLDSTVAESNVEEKAVSADAEEDEIIRQANAEFARLKAQLDGGGGSERAADGTGERERGGDSGAKGGRGLRDGTKRRRDESDTLRRLKAFENRMKRSRKEARRDEHGRLSGAWFERGLRLATSVMEEEEYEVHFSKPLRKR